MSDEKPTVDQELAAAVDRLRADWDGIWGPLPSDVDLTSLAQENLAVLARWRRADPVSYARFVEGRVHVPRPPKLRLVGDSDAPKDGK